MNGKWSDESVPKHDWECVGFADLGPRETEICDMCEVREIRYVHTMHHADYPEDLDCGCVCAANMEKDAAAAPMRERHARNLAARRKHWLRRKWKVSRSGNEYLSADGCTIVVFTFGSSWKARISDYSGNDRISRRVYPSPDAAKLAAFDALPLLKKFWAQRG